MIVKINNLLYKDVFFRNYLKSIEIKNNEFEKQNLTSKYVKNIINKNKFNFFFNIISNKEVSVNITESNLTKIINSFENLNIYNTTEQNIQTFNFVKNPKISIIIPIYISQFYILPIIKSIQAQSLKDIYNDFC